MASTLPTNIPPLRLCARFPATHVLVMTSATSVTLGKAEVSAEAAPPLGTCAPGVDPLEKMLPPFDTVVDYRHHCLADTTETFRRVHQAVGFDGGRPPWGLNPHGGRTPSNTSHQGSSGRAIPKNKTLRGGQTGEAPQIYRDAHVLALRVGLVGGRGHAHLSIPPYGGCERCV